MADIKTTDIEQAIASYVDPYLGMDLVSAGLVKEINYIDGKLVVDIRLHFPAENYRDALCREIRKTIKPLGIEDITVNVTWDVLSHGIQVGVPAMPGVKNIIAVASGKGGVGKSTTAVNLALALKAEGANVGLLDADIYGPSEAIMLGTQNKKPEASGDEKVHPIERFGLQTMSIAYLLEDEEAPMVWRGPMVTRALMQLLQQTEWSDLDYLLIDLPPGTGDIQLTLSQKIPLSGTVIVTTPQDLALADVVKCIKMFEKVNVPVLGVIENMSVYVCKQCGHHEHIFGEDGAAKIAKKFDLNVLGRLPLDTRIREALDKGKPSVSADPESAISLCYREVAHKVSAQLSLKTKDYTRKFPNIVVE